MKLKFFKKFSSMCLCLVLALLLAVGSLPAASRSEAAGNITVYFTIEKFTLGQGFILEPVKVTCKSGSTVSDVLKTVADDHDIDLEYKNTSTYGFYLEGIEDVDSGTSDIPKCIRDMNGGVSNSDVNPGKEKNDYFPDLMEFSYTPLSGWLFAVNNKYPNVGMGKYTLSSGDVVRIAFTLCGAGADLQKTGQPNRDSLIKKMALYNANKNVCIANGYKSAYSSAKKICANLDSSSSQISSAASKLPSSSKISTMVSAAKVTASVKSAATTSITLQWNKVAKASGYRLYLYSGSKYVLKKTITSNSTTSGAVGSLSAGKTYKFKVVPYYNDGGTKRNLSSSVVSGPTKPGKVTLTSCTKPASTKAKLVWKKVSGATGYQIFRATSKTGSYSKIKTITSADTLTYTDTGLSSTKTYFYKVRAYRKAGGFLAAGACSDIKQAK